MTSWPEFLSERHIPRISDERKARMDANLLDGCDRLRDSDSRYFRSKLSEKHMWRLLRDFKSTTNVVRPGCRTVFTTFQA